jgi:hypothetical protein
MALSLIKLFASFLPLFPIPTRIAVSLYSVLEGQAGLLSWALEKGHILPWFFCLGAMWGPGRSSKPVVPHSESSPLEVVWVPARTPSSPLQIPQCVWYGSDGTRGQSRGAGSRTTVLSLVTGRPSG